MNKKYETQKFERILKAAMKNLKKTYSCPVRPFHKCDFECDTKEQMEQHIRDNHRNYGFTELEWAGEHK